MDIGLLPKVRFARAAEACAVVDLAPEALALRTAGMTPAAFLHALVEAGLYVDAIRLMAVALPRREAVWWACLNARGALSGDGRAGNAGAGPGGGDGPPAEPSPETAALDAAEAWVYRPTEENRRAAFPTAEALGFETPAAYAAMAAFWSGGSLAPPDAQVVVPPGDGLTGTAAAATVLLAAVAGGTATGIPARHRIAIEQAIDIANGGDGRRSRA